MANLGANLWAQRRRQDCVYEGTCPEHGRVAVVLEGHHIDTEKAVLFITDECWQEVAFAVSQLNRKPTGDS